MILERLRRRQPTSSLDGLALPPALADRPVDPEVGLPVPFVNDFDGVYDFRTVNRRRSIQCALHRVCGMCGRGLSFDLAFIGGAMAGETRSFVHPPMHMECAEAALRLCPHIARHATAGESTPRRGLRAGVTTAEMFAASRPPEWVLYVTHNFEIERTTAETGGLVLVFHPGPPATVRRFRAGEQGIAEVAEEAEE